MVLTVKYNSVKFEINRGIKYLKISYSPKIFIFILQSKILVNFEVNATMNKTLQIY